MNFKKNEIITDTISKIISNCESDEIFLRKNRSHIPNREKIKEIVKDLKIIMFPGYFTNRNNEYELSEYFLGNLLNKIMKNLKEQIVYAFLTEEKPSPQNLKEIEFLDKIKKNADEIVLFFFEKLPEIQKLLLKDVQAGFDGDPAAQSKEDVIFSYPWLFTIFIYRFAHILYKKNVPLIPRIMTEYAHSKTGIDINAGATIGEYFFIDHGTGVVIGETTIIGNHVKIYQGVTLGALSTKRGQGLKGLKRHPTIKDGVTIYSGATILGGETIIGENSIIGGNAFILESIPPNTRVIVNLPEQKLESKI